MSQHRALIGFYSGARPDHRGRHLYEIVAQSDRFLEANHDFIQWLFPLPEGSPVNPNAPRLDDEARKSFAEAPHLREAMVGAFERMLSFYGLSLRDGVIEKDGERWVARAPNWFFSPTHNDLRITRILRCLVLVGLEAEARAFHAALVKLHREEPRAPARKSTFEFWDAAVKGELP